MSYPIIADKHSDMVTTEYSHAGSVQTRADHQENVFRWPHTAHAPAPVQRPLHNHYQLDHLKQLNSTSTPSRTEFNNRHPLDFRYSYDARTRVEMYNEEQQKLHNLQMLHLQKAGSELRAVHQSVDQHFYNLDARPPFGKKSFHDNNPPNIRPHLENGQQSLESLQKHVHQSEIRHSTYPFAPGISRPPVTIDNALSREQTSTLPSNTLSNNMLSSSTLSSPTNTGPKQTTLESPPNLITPGFMNVSDQSHNMDKDTPSITKKIKDAVSSQNEIKDSGGHSNVKKEQKSQLTLFSINSVVNSKDDVSPSSDNKSSEDSNSPDNGLPSYTAMIAQAILKKEENKSTLSDIYEYMEKEFPSLEKRGTGWRNCVRHTLSLNDCFIKLHRPENGRSCNWAVHPSYFESFSRGDYRKRRALRKRPRGLQWIDPIMLGGYPFSREHELHPEMEQQSSPFYHYPPPHPVMWNSQQAAQYHHNANQQASPSHLQHFPQLPPQPPSHAHPQVHPPMHPNYPPQPNHAHVSNSHCTNPNCYCQFNKNNYRGGVYTP